MNRAVNSKVFRHLERRINEIEKRYIPKVKVRGNYSNKEQDDIRCYLLLAHAEIESYFEVISENKAKKCFEAWNRNRKRSNVLLSLLAFTKQDLKGRSLEKRVRDALTSYIRILKDNHGIKEKNILAILLPLGFEHQDIDQTLLNSLSSFGNSRGKIAHTSARVQQTVDPVSITNEVALIMNEIKNIDSLIKKLI